MKFPFDCYAISDKGRVYSEGRGIVLKPEITDSDCIRYSLYVFGQGRKVKMYASALVREYFSETV